MASATPHREPAELGFAQVAQGDGVGLQAQVHAAAGQHRAEAALREAQSGHHRCRVDARQSAEQTPAVRAHLSR